MLTVGAVTVWEKAGDMNINSAAALTIHPRRDVWNNLHSRFHDAAAATRAL